MLVGCVVIRWWHGVYTRKPHHFVCDEAVVRVGRTKRSPVRKGVFAWARRWGGVRRVVALCKLTGKWRFVSSIRRGAAQLHQEFLDAAAAKKIKTLSLLILIEIQTSKFFS